MHQVVAAIIVDGDRVLLGHRSTEKRWYPDVWDVVGGHVGDGESAEQALIRELREELGITTVGPLGEPLTRVVDPGGEDGGLDITIWTLMSWTGDVRNLAPTEHDELRWFARDELSALKLAHPALPSLLDDVLRSNEGSLTPVSRVVTADSGTQVTSGGLG